MVLDGRAPVADDLAALDYTRMVLRLYPPPTWVTARTPLVDDELRGYRIAAGSIVMLSPFVTHRHPEFWERSAPLRSRALHPPAPGGPPPLCVLPVWRRPPQLHRGRG